MSQKNQAREMIRGSSPLKCVALVLGLGSLSSGCLVLEGDLFEDRRPGNGVNFTPRLEETTLMPPNQKTVSLQSCSQNFSVERVEELDLSDTLTARWFVDGVMASWQTLSPLESNPTFWTGATFLFDASRYDRALHTLLLVVSDGFAEGDELMAAAQGKGKSSVVWAVDTTMADCDVHGEEDGKLEEEEMVECEQ